MQIVYTLGMEFEWDEIKRLANLEKHGIDFVEAEEIFSGPTITRRDTRKDYREERWAVLGRLKGRVVYVAYVKRSDKIRIISLRSASRKERRLYEETIFD